MQQAQKPPTASSFKGEHARKLLLLLHLEWDLEQRTDYNGGFEMSVGNINYWFLDTIPDLLQDLADEITTAPAGMSLVDWRETLNRMVYLFREANTDTSVKYMNDGGRSEDWEAYSNACKTEALNLFNEYFWYLDA